MASGGIRAGLGVLALLALAACDPGGVTAVDTACRWVRLIKPNDDDRLTDRTARAILAHDLAVRANCPEAP